LVMLLALPVYTVENVFVRLVAAFHLSEFCWFLSVHPSTLTFDSFLLNNSKEYTACMLLAAFEFSLPMRRYLYIQCIGYFFAFLGLIVRMVAIWTARAAFTHRLVTERSTGHRLIDTGIYKYMRHPGYAGWLAWAVGCQLGLGNMFCSIVFALISWLFFRERIRQEEFYLIKFFGTDYVSYKSVTRSGILGIP
jgi:protein-S-isoprenylcysteine O-methyltransferase